jgi:hypothetical protein
MFAYKLNVALQLDLMEAELAKKKIAGSVRPASQEQLIAIFPV